MSEKRIDSKLINDIIIKYNKSACVIATCSLIGLDGLELETFNSLIRSIHLLQIFYYVLVKPYIGRDQHLDIWVDPPKVIRGPIYHKHPFDTMFFSRTLSHNYCKRVSKMKGSISKGDIISLF